VLFLLTGLVLPVAGLDTRKELQVDYTDDNPAARYLTGVWGPDAALDLRLGRTNSPWKKVEFERNDRIVVLIPDKYAIPLHRFRIFLAGWMRFEDRSCPFVLISYQGNPTIMYFIEEQKGVFSDARSIRVFLAPAVDRKQDILYLSTGKENDTLHAFKRQ
jgi:hypothetical protein